jgi:type I restriction enzyme S subunit
MIKAYPSYKNSDVEWIGEIPSHWSIRRVKETAKIINGFPFDSKKFNKTKGFPLVRIRDIRKDSTSLKFDGDIPEGSLIYNGDILIGMDGDFNVTEWGGGKAALNQRVACVRTRDKELTKYLYYTLPFNMKVVNDNAFYTTVKHLSNDDIRSTLYPVPPAGELKSVVSYLNKETRRINFLISEKQNFINLLKEKRQALISHVVTKGLDPNVEVKDSGVEWIGTIPKTWTCSSLKHFAKIIDCKHITAEFFDDGIPLASIGEVKEWFVNLEKSKLTSEGYYKDLISGGRKPEPGDIIYSRNATVGKSSIVPENVEKFALGQDVCLIKIKGELNSDFLMYSLRSFSMTEQLEVLMVGATFKRVNVDDIRNFKLSVPPIDQQIEIAHFLNRECVKIEKLVFEVEGSIRLLNEHRTALISAAVTGKIDLRDKEVA